MNEEKWVQFVESKTGKKIEGIYHYFSITDNKYCFTKLRLTDKDIKYGIITNGFFKFGLGHGVSKKSFKAIYGNISEIHRGISEGKQIFVTEGEKDRDTMTKQGFISWTYGGSGDWISDYSVICKDADIIILRDNDCPGSKVAEQIKNDIKAVAKSVIIINPCPEIRGGDISDFFANHSKEDFIQLISTSPAAELSIYDRLVKLNASDYERSDKGWSQLFSDVFADTHRYNATKRDWMYFDGKVWLQDMEGMQARQSAKKLVDVLIRYAAASGKDNDKKEYLSACMKLTSASKREVMLKDARDNNFFSAEHLDTNDYLLNCQNGVLDLSENVKFIPHNSNLLLSKVTNVKYDPSAKCPVWEKFLSEVMLGDEDKIAYLQKIAGVALTGDTSQECCFLLYGASSRNGKSCFTETLLYMLGSYGLTMRPETLSIKANLDSRTASGDIARLHNARLVNSAEFPKRMLFDGALLKSLLGRDSITCRFLHEREFEYIPKFKLLFNTNHLPVVGDDTVFASGRINVVTFDRHFEPHEQDRGLKDKLKNEQELSGILNWCLQGLKMYREQGLIPPKAVQDATAQYRADSDKIGSFINECLIKSDKNSSGKSVYDCYSRWCESNGYCAESKGSFFTELRSKGIFSPTGTVSGKTVHNCVKGYVIADNSDFVKVDKETEGLLFD